MGGIDKKRRAIWFNKLLFYSGISLWAAVFFSNKASTTNGKWLLVLGLILVIPFVRVGFSKWVVKKGMEKSGTK